MTLAVLVASRHGGRFFLALAILAPIAAILSHRGLKIRLTQQYAAAVMTLPELCAVLLVCIAVLVLRPQMWVIDRLGVPGRRWIPSAAALACGVVGPQLVLLVAAGVAMPHRDFSRSAANILFLAGFAFLVAPVSGAFAASGLILVLYFGLTSALQLEPALWPWSPLVVSAGPGGNWTVAVVTVVLAVIVTVRTLGRTRLTWGRDLDLA